MTLSDDLLKPRKHVFMKPKRRWGMPSLILGAVTAGALTLVYASFAGWITPDGLAMLAVGLLGALVLPLLLALRLRASGPRAFAGVNTVAVLVLFTLLGKPTDRALAVHGTEPFRAVASVMGEGEERAKVTELGDEVVSALRRLTLGQEAHGPAVQAVMASNTVEVPISPVGRTFSIQARVGGKVDAAFTFDTGAELTAITPALAERLGVDTQAAERRQFLTAGGPIEAPVVRLSSLAVEGAEVRGLEAVVCDQCPSNLLGRNFHEYFKVEIDGGDGVVRLRRR